MVRTFLKVSMELGSSFLFLQEQIKDIIIIIRGSPNSQNKTSERKKNREPKTPRLKARTHPHQSAHPCRQATYLPNNIQLT
jgi:hypothetical protein